MATKPKRQRDPIALAKMIGDIATGEIEDVEPPKVRATRESGTKGGVARANKLTPEQRSQIALLGAQARWKKSN